MTENTLPQELIAWIEKEANRIYSHQSMSTFKGIWIAGAANLYAHLRPLIDEKDETITLFRKTIQNYAEEILRQDKLLDAKDEEIKRNSISFATFITDNQYEFSKKDCQWYRSTLDYDVKDEDELWQEFKTQNNL